MLNVPFDFIIVRLFYPREVAKFTLQRASYHDVILIEQDLI